MKKLKNNCVTIIIIVLAIIFGVIVWSYIEWHNANSNVIPEIRLQEIDFPENPQIKKKIYQLTERMDSETKGNRIYIVNIYCNRISALKGDINDLRITINWVKDIYSCSKNFQGYFLEENSIFIVRGSEIPIEIVSPGKSWRIFKSQTAYPFIGKNVRWSYCYSLIYGNVFELYAPKRLEFNEKIARRYRDSLDIVMKVCLFNDIDINEYDKTDLLLMTP